MNNSQKSKISENSEKSSFSSKLKPELKLADKFLDLKTLDTNIILNHLDEQIQVREMSVEKRLKKDLLK
jgi:hypothetical protein